MDLQLYINDELAEIDSGVIAPLTYSIADVKSPDKRSRNRSKTIEIKGTQNNLNIFYSAYNISLEDEGIGFDFNPNAELPARIYRNGTLIFNGVANYLETKKSGGVYSFQFQVFGNSISLFEALGDLTLQQLDWSEYDHTLTVANLALSWDTSVDVNGVPTSNFTAGVPDGFGYLYGLVNWGYGGDQSNPQTNQLLPQLYVKETLEKCFAVAGYTITGSFINNTVLKRIVYGRGGGELITISSAEVAARFVDYDFNGTLNNSLSYSSVINTGVAFRTVFYFSKSYILGNISPITATLNTDGRAQFDPTNGIFTVASSGTYAINLDADIDLDTFNFVGGTFTQSSKKVVFQFYINVNGTPQNVQNLAWFSAPLNQTFTTSTQLFLNAGDEVTIDFKTTLSNTYATVAQLADAPTLALDWTINNFNVTLNSIDKELTEGDTVELGRWVPEMKARDFVNSIVTMANLYLSEPNENNEIRIDPFTDYYGQTSDAENWTEKLDHSKDMTISSNAGIDGKVYRFKFAEDRDAYKQYYFERWGSDYGDYNFNVPTTFKKGEKVYKVDFAQTVPVQVGALVIPQVVKMDPVTNVISPYKGKPRIFIYNGLQTGAWSLKNSATKVATNYASYPQLHHTFSLTATIFDLNFGVPLEIYYTATQYTTNNLFAAYYDIMIKELTSPDSKFVTSYFKLNEGDLQGEFMRNLVNVNGSIFRKNVIQDFDATGYATTKVELIKVLDADSRATTIISQPIENQNNTLRLANVPAENTGENTDTAATIEYNSRSFSMFNTDPASAVSVTLSNDMPDGTRKTIGNQNGSPMTITADSGQISGNNEVQLIGAGDIMTFIIYSGNWYIDSKGGSIYTAGLLVEPKTADFTAVPGVSTYECDTNSNDITATLPIDVPEGTRWTFKKVSGLSRLIIKGEGNGVGGFYPVDEDEDGAEVLFNNSAVTIEKSYNNEFKIIG